MSACNVQGTVGTRATKCWVLVRERAGMVMQMYTGQFPATAMVSEYRVNGFTCLLQGNTGTTDKVMHVFGGVKLFVGKKKKTKTKQKNPAYILYGHI